VQQAKDGLLGADEAMAEEARAEEARAEEALGEEKETAYVEFEGHRRRSVANLILALANISCTWTHAQAQQSQAQVQDIDARLLSMQPADVEKDHWSRILVIQDTTS
jgi:hypothetical protein